MIALIATGIWLTVYAAAWIYITVALCEDVRRNNDESFLKAMREGYYTNQKREGERNDQQ